ncbi:MAG TPA: M48 family metallopeptidase [Acidobacteriota bacterium]|nr:M48 family metallopeptidase [Acidobacteriota bacterium]
MAKKKTNSTRIHFPGLDPIAFQHAADREAMKKLDRMPGMQTVLRKVSGGYIEKTLRMLNTAERVRVGPRQCPKVYELFRESCAVLDIKEIPEIYLATVYTPNAFSFGIQRFTVVLLTGLVDLLTEDELRFVIAHELSHIKCNHMMYRTLLYILNYVGIELFGTLFKVASIAFFPLEMALRSWERKAEFSGDRGGLLVAQDIGIVQSALVKLAGASKSLLNEINMKEILKQADELQNMDDEIFVRAMKMYHTAIRSHPFPIIRIKELHNWSQSNQYKRILEGAYKKRNESHS